MWKVLFLYEIIENCKHFFQDAVSRSCVYYIFLKAPLEPLIRAKYCIFLNIWLIVYNFWKRYTGYLQNFQAINEGNDVVLIIIIG